ncbi:metabotropic glutamate receptor-like protein P [Sparus aurata]|uniref:metabotropic glutamate receptor-like protein P n=1 Tax=Sparus aurata TaxID=8175 RepID=UPI0011C156F6|nr:metabotropic glutamate receptor-like protein P [Sparus aurata]XP_030292667.1 metabotropic glutamate receptor-like protein P [Sparus aurata]XP_030292668.1 metabotropic glutamate receptor-like protein P [Sparus aurata]
MRVPSSGQHELPDTRPCSSSSSSSNSSSSSSSSPTPNKSDGNLPRNNSFQLQPPNMCSPTVDPNKTPVKSQATSFQYSEYNPRAFETTCTIL